MTRALLLLLSVAGCAPAAPVAQAPAAPAGAEGVPNDIRWVRTAAEHRALFLQTYRSASERLREVAAGREPGTWAVILDADETVLDNSLHQLRFTRRGERFDLERWNEWVREKAAPALPGSVEFVRLVRELGGRVAIVTNRDDVVCPETRENLARVGIQADVVLCRVQRVSDKNPRFRAVESGTAAPTLPPLRVLMYVGDNIQDFPGLSQSSTGEALEPFGRSYWMVPNPMYGSWEENPVG